MLPPPNKATKRRAANSGFSLIEVMVAGAVFLLSVAGTLSVVSSAHLQYQHQRNLSVATHVGEALMEELLLGYTTDNTLFSAGIHGPRYYDKKGLSIATATNSKYSATWTVTGDAPITGVRTIRVTVRWQERGFTKSLRFITYRS